MFNNLYEGYRNYQPQEVKPTNEREALLQQVQQLQFAMIDLGLYLDTHPKDSETTKLYNNYRNQEKQLTDQFERIYGPLTLNSEALNKSTWVWNNAPWPWEAE